MDTMMGGEARPSQSGALVAALLTEGQTVDELTGMVESMRAAGMTAISAPWRVGVFMLPLTGRG